MKKFMAFTIALLFLMVMASAVFAAETTFKGEYQVRAWAEWNFDKKPAYGGQDKEAQYDGWFDQRFRLLITHERSEFLKAVIRFDLVEDTWGQQRNFRVNNTTAGNYIDWAYIEFKLPKIGTFTVGKQPVTFANSIILGQTAPGLDGIKWSNKWGPVAVSALYLKYNDQVLAGAAMAGDTGPFGPSGPGSVSYNWDANLWALDLKVTPNEDHAIELYGGALVSNFGWPLLNSSRNSWGVWIPMLGATTDYESYTAGFAGIAYTGDIANMIAIKAEYGHVFGKAHLSDIYSPSIGGVPLRDEIALEGWSTYLDVSYYNDMLKVGLAFFMSSGQKHWWGGGANTVTSLNMPSILQQGFRWGNVLGSDTWPGLNHVGIGPGFGDNRFALENVTSVKLYFEISPMEKLTLNAAVIWAKWTDPVGSGINVLSDGPAYRHPANYYSNYTAIGVPWASWDASTDLGWEIDFGLSYEIMEGLTYSMDAGVLLTGDSWDYVDWDGTRKEWGPIWTINNTLMYRF